MIKIDIHFNGYKVKYAKLNSFFRPIKSSHVINNINIFINIDDLFRMLHRPLINNEFQVCGHNAHKQLVSNVFNILAHYRNWAIKERIDVKVYGIYTTAIRSFKNSIHVHDYRKKFIENNDPINSKYYFINEAIRNSTPVIPVISNYIPNVYMIDSKYLEPSMIPLYIADNVYKADWNILISRDTYDIQYSYKDKWTFISPKGENSRHISRKDIWDYVNVKERVYKEPVELTYDHHLYIYAKSLVGDTYRNIPRLRRIGWKTLFSYLDKIKDEYGENDISITAQNYLLELLQNKKISSDELNSNIYATNIDIQMDSMMEIDRASIDSQLMDIPDYENLKQMNKIMFGRYPLNLDFLCSNVVKRTPFD